MRQRGQAATRHYLVDQVTGPGPTHQMAGPLTRRRSRQNDRSRSGAKRPPFARDDAVRRLEPAARGPRRRCRCDRTFGFVWRPRRAVPRVGNFREHFVGRMVDPRSFPKVPSSQMATSGPGSGASPLVSSERRPSERRRASHRFRTSTRHGTSRGHPLTRSVPVRTGERYRPAPRAWILPVLWRWRQPVVVPMVIFVTSGSDAGQSSRRGARAAESDSLLMS